MTTRFSELGFRLVLLALALATPLATRSARAQGGSDKGPSSSAASATAADIESARALYKEGKERRERGDLPGALEKFQAAHALAATPITAFELGQTYAKLGRLAEGREVLLSVARLPRLADESPKAAAARADAEQLAQSLKGRLGTVSIRLSRTASPPAKITLDGAPLSDAALLVPRILDPGKHTVVASIGTVETRTDVEVAEGEARELLVQVPPDAPAAVSREPAPAGAAAPEDRPTRGVFYAGLATAGAGLVVGSIAGALTLAKASSLKTDCPSGRCPPASHDALDGARTLGAVSTIGFAVAGAGAALAVVGLFLPSASRARTTASVRPCVGALSLAACGVFP